MNFVQLTQGPSRDSFIHDIVFDFYGKRFATASTDAKIAIFDEQAGSWNNSFIISEAHAGCIWRLSWAHPEFGNLIASCSDDRTVCIWEEQVGVARKNNEGRERWLKKAQLTDSKKPINDVKFAPRHHGLKLATASADGCVRIYEAADVFSLSYWQLQNSFYAEDTTLPDVSQPSSFSSQQPSSSLRSSEHGITCLAWNECIFEPAKIAVGGYSKRAVVFGFDSLTNRWEEECELGDPRAPLGGAIHDIAWAPVMGRSFHLIATASRENSFKIHTLQRSADNMGSLVYKSTHVEVCLKSAVWRVAWNATGTVLATSSEDGTLSLWRKDFGGIWRNVQELPAGSEASRSFYNNP